MQPNLLPPRPRAVLGPPLPRTNHRSSSLSPHHPQHFLFCAALLLAATAAHRVAADEAGEAGEADEADGNALTNDKFLRKEKCDLFERCVPTKFDYTNLNENSAALPPPSQWPQCLGPFVLCSVANCTILPKTGGPLGLFPRQAECGCLSPPAVPTVVGPSLVTPTIIKDGALNDAVNRECFGGESPSTKNNTCTEVNSAPVCKAINDRTIYKGTWPLISTFAAYADQDVKVCKGKPDGSSITADCMTAACYRRGAFDGSPFVCYCPVVAVPPGANYAVGYPRSKFPDGISCDQPEGYVLSGA